MLCQRTVREKASITGIGVHSGQQVSMEILPAPADNGITFTRTDMGLHQELRASVHKVADTTLATTLAAGVNGSRAVVNTVEHLLAALAGLGIDNARVLIDGPEVPILDGSAVPWVNLLMGVGIDTQWQPKRFLVMKKEVKVVDGDREATLSPGSGLRVCCSIDFDHPLISTSPFNFQFSERGFQRELAPARTFGFLRDVEAMRAKGLARGGSLDNAIVIDRYRVLNPEGLRYPDEFVRHKVLDAMGDLALFGMPVVGRLCLRRSGHATNTQLVRKVLDDPKNFEIVEPAEAEMQRAADGEETLLRLFQPVESWA